MTILVLGCVFKAARLYRIPSSIEYLQLPEGREVVFREAADGGAPPYPADGILCKAITTDGGSAS